MPERIPIDMFVEFVATRGPGRIAVVKRFKDHRYADHLLHFWKLLREAIVAMHEGGGGDMTIATGELDVFLAGLEDERKRRLYPGMVAGYRKFLDAAGTVRSFGGAKTILPVGDLEIHVTADLGLKIGGVQHLVALHLGGRAPSRLHADVTLGLMTAAFGPGRPGTVIAILDVANARLLTLKQPNPRLGLLARGEAEAFATIYGAV